MKKIEMGKKPYLLPMPIILAGATIKGKANYMPVAFCGVLQNNPAMIGIAIGPSHYTNKAIKETQGFSVNIPSTKSLEVTDYCGIVSGTKIDKEKLFSNFYGILEKVPMIEECPVNLECRLVSAINLGGSHELFIGEVVQSYINEDCLNDGKTNIKEIDPILYLFDKNEYINTGDFVGKAYRAGKDYMMKQGTE